MEYTDLGWLNIVGRIEAIWRCISSHLPKANVSRRTGWGARLHLPSANLFRRTEREYIFLLYITHIFILHTSLLLNPHLRHTLPWRRSSKPKLCCSRRQRPTWNRSFYSNSYRWPSLNALHGRRAFPLVRPTRLHSLFQIRI